MLRVRFEVDDSETLKEFNALNPRAHIAAWAEAVRKLAEGKALNLGSRVGPRAADAITVKTEALKAEILLDGPDARMAAHIHFGGPIQSSNGKVLAIPTKWNANKEDFASTYGENYFVLLRSKKRNRAYLFKNPAKGEKLGRPMFVLTPKTRPQKPRPWWPTAEEVEAATVNYFEENF